MAETGAINLANSTQIGASGPMFPCSLTAPPLRTAPVKTM